MFEHATVFILATNNEVYQLPLDQKTRDNIVCILARERDKLLAKTPIKFDGSYKPNKDEYLYIDKFNLDDQILDAIRNPIGVQAFKKENDNYPEIKAVFVGERNEKKDSEVFHVVFQLFKKDQRLSTGRYNIFHNNDTFKEITEFGFSILYSVECCFEKDQLIFQSFYYARQIFDLSTYYRSATDDEVNSFINNPKLSFMDKEAFLSQADSWTRRRIAIINDSEVLENFSINVIIELADNMGLCMAEKDGRLLIPSDKNEMKKILGFLDEEAYKGPFSNDIYLANSKRKLS